jgi:hypothetical protein
MTNSQFLYQIISQADCFRKIGHDLSNGSLMSCRAPLKKEDFYPNGNPFGSGDWHIELREKKFAEQDDLSPFRIYQYYDGAGSFGTPISVFAIQDAPD